MTPKVPDYGHQEADKELQSLIKRLHNSYKLASTELQKKIDDYLVGFEKEDAEKRALYDSGEMSHEAFIKWRQKMITDTRAWRDMLEQLSDDMTHQNQIAASMIDDTLPGVYALNHNYGTYEAEVGSGYDTTYTLYDRNTVKRLLTEDEDMLPRPSVPVKKDKLWNKQHLQSAVLQGILTGESMGDIAKRFQSVTDMTERAAMRNARTAVTGAENSGRIDSYIRAQNMGINMKQMWMATLDARTRDSHAIMDGEQQEVGKKFSNGCRYPGDPQGAPAEVYNCRCTTVAIVEGADPYNPNLRPSEYLKEEGLTYEQWKEMHGERFYSKLFKDVQDIPAVQQPAFHIVQGQDISGSWIRRPEKYDFAIDDVVNAQGFDGLPRVVSSDEFDNFVKNSGIICKRGYIAPDSATLELYKNELYNGKWYIDCSHGQAAHGQGMYSVAAYGDSLNEHMQHVVEGYGNGQFGRVETFTLSNPKIINADDINKEKWQFIYETRLKALDEPLTENQMKLFKVFSGYPASEEEKQEAFKLLSNREDAKIASEASAKAVAKEGMNEKFNEIISMDDGVFAAMRGYDAIEVDINDKGDMYFVILNRTKVIFKGE